MNKKDFYESKYPKCPHQNECSGYSFKCEGCKHKPKKDWYEYTGPEIRPYFGDPNRYPCTEPYPYNKYPNLLRYQ